MFKPNDFLRDAFQVTKGVWFKCHTLPAGRCTSSCLSSYRGRPHHIKSSEPCYLAAEDPQCITSLSYGCLPSRSSTFMPPALPQHAILLRWSQINVLSLHSRSSTAIVHYEPFWMSSPKFNVHATCTPKISINPTVCYEPFSLPPTLLSNLSHELRDQTQAAPHPVQHQTSCYSRTLRSSSFTAPQPVQQPVLLATHGPRDQAQ